MDEQTGRVGKYASIIQHVFRRHYTEGVSQFAFSRDELEEACAVLRTTRPKNLGDVVHSFRMRSHLPQAVRQTAPKGKHWHIRLCGSESGETRYTFVLVDVVEFQPSQALAQTKVPDSTPGVVSMYALSDEQALLARLRYNRLVDIFTGIACHHLQSHVRAQLEGMGQVEVDDLFVGIDRRGAHSIVPVEAKGRGGRLRLGQVEQCHAFGVERWPHVACRPIGAKECMDGSIALFEFESDGVSFKVASEKHYRLVPPDQLTTDELQAYRSRLE